MNKLQRAYAIGFCKTAEAYGVDPEGLYKYAINIGAVANATKNMGLLGSFGYGMKQGWNTSILGRFLNPAFRRVGKFFRSKPNATQTLKDYTSRVRRGHVPSTEETRASINKVLSEYFA